VCYHEGPLRRLSPCRRLLLHLVVEIKGFRGNNAIAKADAIKTYWMPGVNHLNSHGRWAFAEFCDVYEIQADFASKVEAQFNSMIAAALPASA
jgi:type III restriction enzyme